MTQNPLKMPNKFSYISILFILLIGNACSNKNEELSKSSNNKKRGYTKFVDLVDGMLPKNIDKKKYLIIYRTGSIEYSSDYSVLCIPKEDLNKKKIQCSYFMLNNLAVFNPNNSVLDEDEPTILGFSFWLENRNLKQILLSNLKSYTLDELDIYVRDKLIKHPGEGHCNNFYFISSDNGDSLYVLDVNSDIKEKNYFINLYKQISPSEYLQTLSLDNKCTNDGFELYIELNKNDKYSFVLEHGDKGRYW